MKVNKKEQFIQRIQEHRLIATVNKPDQLERVIKYKENISAVTLVTGNILTLKRYVDLLHKEGLPVIINVEKIDGLKMDNYGVDFVIEYVKPFGILSTKKNIIKRAKAKGTFVVQMVFMYDTIIYKNLTASLPNIQVDLLEIMPCRATDILEEIVELSPIPVITGGLVTSTELAQEVLKTGVASISTANVDIWKQGLKREG